ncbi:MAG: hypothetical protein LBO06_06865 [Bacteroidales bacterium]|nr:hypothetical protein [Bacteroidales bacterium]
MKKNILTSFLIAAILLCGCSKDDRSVPKPKAYIRMDVPPPQYVVFDTSSLPFTFQYPDYGEVVPNSFEPNNNWFNLVFERYGYILYLTYVPLKTASSLDTLVSDSDKMAYYSHRKRATGVASRAFNDDLNRVYATTFQIKGSDVATPYQFYITDSSKHFLRASLNYTQTPNNDSLAPVLNRISADLEHIISTFRWKSK